MQFILIAVYLSLAVHLGLNSLYHSLWGWPVICGIFAAQAVITHFLCRKEKFADSFSRVLFSQFPLTLLILNNSFWPVLQVEFLYALVVVLIILFAIYAFRKEIGGRRLNNLLSLTLPLVIPLSMTSQWKLVQFTNPWRFFAEEGQVMSWVTNVLHGGVPYKDMIMTRGPVAIYSLAAVLKLLGETLINARAGLLALAVLMAYLYSLFCRTFIESGVLRWLAFVVMFLVHEFSYRTGFSLAVLALFWIALRKNNRAISVLSGTCAALALLSSIEAGISCLAAVLVTAAAGFFLHVPERRTYLRHGALAASGLLLIFLPLCLVLLWRGELGRAVEGAVVYPKYAMLGFAAVPFPNLLQSINADVEAGHFLFPGTHKVFALWYLPVLIYLFTFFLFLRWAFSRSIDPRSLMLLTVSVYGWVLFRSALGRSDLHHLYFCVPPALALFFVQADRLKGSSSWNSLPGQRDRLLMICVACLSPLWFLCQRPQDRPLNTVQNLVANLKGSSYPQASYRPFPSGRLQGVFLPNSVSKKVELVMQAINSQRKAGDAIYAFPNLPLYYFLFDSPNPTRYAWAYQAITHEMRLEVVESLRKASPQFVIISVDPHQRLDRIPAREALPEILKYIQENYKRWTTIGREEILVPKDSKLREQDLPEPEENPFEEGPPEPGEDD